MWTTPAMALVTFLARCVIVDHHTSVRTLEPTYRQKVPCLSLSGDGTHDLPLERRDVGTSKTYPSVCTVRSRHR